MGKSRTNKTSLVFPAKVTSLSPAVMTNVQLLFGPMLIGVFLNMILYGVLIVQTYSYYQEYKSDSLWIKFLVYYLFIIETANTAFDMLVMYEPLILHYGLPEATANFPRFFAAEPFVIVAVSTPIQIFFAWRIHKLTKSSWVAVLVVLLAFVSLAGGIWTGTEIVILKLFSKKPLLHTPALVWFLSSCVADVLITLVLVYSLSKRKTGFSATDDAIAKIIRTTVQTGMLTAIFAVGDVVFFMTLPRTALNFLWDLALSKLYANCLLSTLNARRALKEKVVSSNNHRISTAPRRQLDTFESSHVMSPSYELEHQKHFDHTSTYHRDVEFGITVTKVVETIEDPHPHGRNPTQ